MPTSNVIPSFTSGFATHADESDAPEQWAGLVGLWSPGLGFQGQTLFDWSGYGLHGTLANVTLATVWTAGAMGTQLTFAGGTEYVGIGNQTLHNFGAGVPFAISLWVRPIAATTNGDTFLKKRGTAGFQLFYNITGPLLRIDEGAANIDLQATVNPTVGIYNHFLVGRTATAVYQYLNGAPNGSTASTSLADLTDAATLQLFQDGIGQTAAWNGDFGEVRIYRGFHDPGALARAIFSDPGALLRRRAQARRRQVSATQSNLNVSGSLTPSGVVSRSTTKVLAGSI